MDMHDEERCCPSTLSSRDDRRLLSGLAPVSRMVPVKSVGFLAFFVISLLCPACAVKTTGRLGRLLQDATNSHTIDTALKACRQFGTDGTCSTHPLGGLDHSLKAAGGVAGLFSSVKLHAAIDQTLTFELAPTCYTDPAPGFRVGQARYNLSLAPVPEAANCTLTPGVWFLAADLHHKQESLYEDLLTTLYPLYLMTHVACNSVFPDIMITHGEKSCCWWWQQPVTSTPSRFRSESSLRNALL